MKQLSIDIINNTTARVYDNSNIIRSVYDSQNEVLAGMVSLYCKNGVDYDPTYSKGVFYKKIDRPRFVSDISAGAGVDFVSDVRNISVRNGGFKTIMFDPPFLATQPSGRPMGEMIKRFSLFKTMKELYQFYKDSLIELHRVLSASGILIFKCQDQVSSGKQFIVHNFIINTAESIGFFTEDIFILVSNTRLINKFQVNQFHARKYHSYFLIFRKGE